MTMPLTHPFFTESPDGCRLNVHVQPKARRCAVVGLHGDALKVALDAPPVDGRANAALCRFLAEVAGLAPSAVVLERGQTSRHKRVFLPGIDGETLLRALACAGLQN